MTRNKALLSHGITITITVSGRVATIISSGTIMISQIGGAPITASGVVTGAILQVRLRAGKKWSCFMRAPTHDYASTSHVLEGTSDVIAANNRCTYKWHGKTSL